MVYLNISIIPYESSIKTTLFVNSKERKNKTENSQEVKKWEIVNLKVPNPFREEKENTIPYLCRINSQKKKKRTKSIILLTVPEVKQPEEVNRTGVEIPLEDEKLNFEEFVSIPTVKRLSSEELREVTCMLKSRKKKKKKSTSNQNTQTYHG